MRAKNGLFTIHWRGVLFMAAGAFWCLAALVGGVAVNLRTRAQDEPKAVASATPTATPTLDASLGLTKDELSEIDAINNEAKPLAEELGRSYRDFFAAKTAAERCRQADALWIAEKQLQPLRDKQMDWLGKVRKAHSCLECPVENGRLVRSKSQ